MNKKQPPQRVRKVGRPLSFDREKALHQAMLVFWKQGYEATSLSDLTKAMGVTPPSIYTAFGDKKRLFLEAVERYVGNPMMAEALIDGADTARDAAWALLSGAAVGYTGKKTPAGCLLASAALACSSEASDVRTALAAIRLSIEKRLMAKIANEIVQRQLPRGTNAEVLAGLVMAVIQGMSTLARDGADRDKLMQVATLSMGIWPTVDRLPL